MPYSFPQLRRLRASYEFAQVWDKGKKCSVRGLAAISCINTHGYPRLGISISKRTIRHAVHRNRIKRLVRETFRLRQTQLPSADIVVVVYKGVDTLTPQQQHQLLQSLWERLRV